MVNGCLQATGFTLGVLGWIAGCVTCFLPTWRKSDLAGEVIEAVFKTTGLWVRCTYQVTGLWTCDDYDSFFLGLPVALQASRALCVLSIIGGLIGTVLCALGLKCTSIGSSNVTMKARMVVIAGILHVIGGVAVGAAVSWMASDILQEYNNPLLSQTGQRYVYGEALFIGWIAMAISVIGGLVMCCSSWNSDDDDNHGRSYVYNPPRAKPAAAEYI